jgi:hypothetical protein
MRIENSIIFLSRNELVGLFSKGYPISTNIYLNDEFTHISPDDRIRNTFIYNQFNEVCHHRGFIFEGFDRVRVIQTIKNGSPELDFDDYVLED